MKCGARKKLSRGPLHSIWNSGTDIKHWEGCIWCNLDSNMGEATEGRNFDVNIGRAAWESCSATWNLGTNSAFALRAEENHGKPWSSATSQDLPDTCWLLASSPAFKPTSPNCNPCLWCCFICYLRIQSVPQREHNNSPLQRSTG
jgi:hypothetical protein